MHTCTHVHICRLSKNINICKNILKQTKKREPYGTEGDNSRVYLRSLIYMLPLVFQPALDLPTFVIQPHFFALHKAIVRNFQNLSGIRLTFIWYCSVHQALAVSQCGSEGREGVQGARAAVDGKIRK